MMGVYGVNDLPFLIPFFYIIVPIVGILATLGLLKWVNKKEERHT